MTLARAVYVFAERPGHGPEALSRISYRDYILGCFIGKLRHRL